MFKYRCECEYCGHEELLTKDEMGIVCPECNDTGDTRTNEEKYGCKRCEHYQGLGMCLLEPVYIIEDILCPLKGE